MRTERCFSSIGLLEMLPIYQLRLIILGVYGSAQDMAIAVHTPAFYGGNGTDAVSITNANVVYTAVMVQMLFL
jgi:hypothetical protein